MASASAQGNPILETGKFLGTGKSTSSRQSCSGQVFRPVRSSPTAQVLLLYSFFSLSQDLLTKKEKGGKDIVITNVTMIREIQKVRKGEIEKAAYGGGTLIFTEVPEDVSMWK